MISKDIHPLFKGLTRPATLLGVPLTPLFFCCAVWILVSVVFLGSLIFALMGLPFIIVVLKLVIKAGGDERAFEVYFLKFRFWLFSARGRSRQPNFYKLGQTRMMFKSVALSPSGYSKAKKISDKQNIGGIIDYSGHIPYSSHLTESVVITAEGDLIATWELKGVAFETKSNADLEVDNNTLHTLIASLGASGKGISIYQHRTRSDFDLEYDQHFINPFAQKVNDAYQKSLKQRSFKQQRLFFTIIYRPYNRTEKATLSAENKRKERQSHLADFNEIIVQATTFLKIYFPSLLKEDKNGEAYSEPISFFNFLLTGKYQKIRVGNAPFYYLLGDKRFYFIKNTAEISDPATGESSYARCLEIKEYSDKTYQGIFDALIYLNTNFVITNSFTTIPKNEALKKIKQQANRLQSSNDDSISQQAELLVALDEVSSGKISFGNSHFSCVIFAKSLDELRKMTGEARQALENQGFITTVADASLSSNFFAQLPANLEYRPRVSMISSWNFANMIDMHAFQLGRAENNAWGQSVTVLPTPSKQVYHLNFHEIASENDLGADVLAHTLVTGQSGSGKTFFVNYLLNQAQKFADPSTFLENKKKKFSMVFFDKDYGAKGHILALGGRYITLKNGEPTGFNPFMCEDTPDNRNFLFQLFRRLATQNVKTFTDRQVDELDQAINAVMTLPKEMRIHGVTRLREFLKVGTTQEEIDNSLHIRLKQWTQGNKFGWVLDNENDSFNLDDAVDNFGIDGTEFLQNPEVCGVITFYLLHRVMQLIDGRRLIIAFDEFWLWLSDPVFEDFVKDKLKTFRKLNAFLVCATQSPSDCLQSEISAAIIEQCPTQIYLANPKAERSEYVDVGINKRNFNMTEKEFELIRGFAPHERKALIKNSQGSSIVHLDLSGIGKYAKLLSTGINESILIDDLRLKNPENWLNEFLEGAHKTQN